MTPTTKKAAAVGGLSTAGLVMWLLAQVFALGAQVARLEERIEAQKDRITFFHGLKTLDEIKVQAEKEPAPKE